MSVGKKFKRRMGLRCCVTLCSLFFLLASVAAHTQNNNNNNDGISSSSSSLMPSASALASVSALHVGVAYDVVRGSVRNVRLFGGAPKVAMDSFQAKLNVDVKEVNTLHHLQQTYASQIGVDLLRGMFVRAPLPFYNPETVAKKEEVACFLSVRSDELLVMQLDPSVMDLSSKLKEAIAALPDDYNATDASIWAEFFQDFGTHWTESAVLGGKLLISSLTEKRDGITSTDIKRSLAIGIQDWFSVGGNTKMEKSIKEVLSSTSDRITAEGGDNRFIGSTSKELSRERYQQWVNSVREKPAVVRYRVQSIADLVSGKKRVAMRSAIAGYLGAAHDKWIQEEESRDAVLMSLRQSHQQVQGLLGDLNASIAILEKEKSMLVSDIRKIEVEAAREKHLKDMKELVDCKERATSGPQKVIECEKSRGVCITFRKTAQDLEQACQNNLLSCEKSRSGLRGALENLTLCEKTRQNCLAVRDNARQNLLTCKIMGTSCRSSMGAHSKSTVECEKALAVCEPRAKEYEKLSKDCEIELQREDDRRMREASENKTNGWVSSPILLAIVFVLVSAVWNRVSRGVSAQYYLGAGFELGSQTAMAIYWYTQAANQGHAEAQYMLGVRCYNGHGMPQDHAKAVEWFAKAADQGEAEAQFHLGNSYYQGHGVVQDYAKAVVWFTKAADQGKAEAQFNLGICYYHGRGIQDYAKAVAWFTKAADQGDAEAQFNLGNCYFKGEGVPQNHANAVVWYSKAAYHGVIEASYRLGDCYYNGHGVVQDYTKAVEWYTEAAGRGHTDAQLNLGNCYYNGHGVPQDRAKAVELYTKAANQGSESAQYQLGLCFEKGFGVRRDGKKALEFLTKAANHGHPGAQNSLGNCHYRGDGVVKSDTKAVEWYTKAADRGHAEAQYGLGICYYYGHGVPQDRAKAVELYTKAANQGYANAQFNLGNSYHNGQGVLQDYTKAAEWFTKGANQGSEWAQYQLGLCFEKGFGVRQDGTKALEWYTKAAAQGHSEAKKKLKNNGRSKCSSSSIRV